MTVIYSEKLWGRGRSKQLARRGVCFLRGHRWTAWWHDEGMRSRRCTRKCGAVDLEHTERWMPRVPPARRGA